MGDQAVMVVAFLMDVEYSPFWRVQLSLPCLQLISGHTCNVSAVEMLLQLASYFLKHRASELFILVSKYITRAGCENGSHVGNYVLGGN